MVSVAVIGGSLFPDYLDFIRENCKKINFTFKHVNEDDLNFSNMSCCKIFIILVKTELIKLTINKIAKTFSSLLQDSIIILESFTVLGKTTLWLDQLRIHKATVFFSVNRPLKKEACKILSYEGDTNNDSNFLFVKSFFKALYTRVEILDSFDKGEMAALFLSMHELTNKTLINELDCFCKKNKKNVESYEIIELLNEAYPKLELFTPSLTSYNLMDVLQNYLMVQKTPLLKEVYNQSQQKASDTALEIIDKMNNFNVETLLIVGLGKETYSSTDEDSPILEVIAEVQRLKKIKTLCFFDPYVLKTQKENLKKIELNEIEDGKIQPDCVLIFHPYFLRFWEEGNIPIKMFFCQTKAYGFH